jgi:uncharacterized membrane protein HdeD (DUF308 family)/pimeloyl-ACP methyl ester carboxylesterase
VRLRIIGGAALVAVGVALLALATRGTAAVAAIAAAGLALQGALRGASAARRRARGAARGDWLPDAAAAGALVAAAAGALAWRAAPVRGLAAVLAAGLAVHGVVSAVAAVRGSRPDRAVGVMGGLAALAAAVLAVAWPRLSVFVLALVVGGWLVATGLATVAAALRRRVTPRVPRGVRRAVRALATAGALVVALLAVAGTAWVYRGDARVAPDGFYDPPAGVPAEPGRLLRSEPLERGVPEGLRAWRILYTTTDGEGRAQVASGVVLAPPTQATGGRTGDGSPVIAVGHGTTGVVPRCAPSLAAEPFADGASAALERLVRDGWVGVMSDYVGLGTAGPHAYLVGPDAAHHVLDAVRAARELDGTALADDVVVWGHSQGGHAALWTGLLAPTYAPDVALRGVAAFAPATDLTSLAVDLAPTAIGKLVAAYLVASWDEVFPELGLRAQVPRGYAGVVDRIADHCFLGRDVLAAFAAATQLTSEVLPRSALEGGLGELLAAETPSGEIDVPVLLAQGDADLLVLPGQQRRFVADWCAGGQAVDYREYPGLDHLSLVAADSPLTEELVAWTRDRVAGVPATSLPASCQS